jgi:toxin ParE1/3/4
MTTLRLREEALADLANIADYGASSHGWPAAEAYLQSIDGALEQLKSYPLSGVARPELAIGLRSLSFRQHHIFYVFLNDHVSVVRVLHKTMDAERWVNNDRLWEAAS